MGRADSPLSLNHAPDGQRVLMSTLWLAWQLARKHGCRQCAYQRVHTGTLVQGALADLLSGFVETQSMHEKKDMVWTADG